MSTNSSPWKERRRKLLAALEDNDRLRGKVSALEAYVEELRESYAKSHAKASSLEQELTITQGFYQIAISERNLAWHQIESLKLERKALMDELERLKP